MKNFETVQEIIDFVNSENYWFSGNQYENYSGLVNASNSYFLNITEEYENQEAYFEKFGLKKGESHIDEIRYDLFWCEETNCTVKVVFYEGYVDSGVNEEDYFHGYLIEY